MTHLMNELVIFSTGLHGLTHFTAEPMVDNRPQIHMCIAHTHANDTMNGRYEIQFLHLEAVGKSYIFNIIIIIIIVILTNLDTVCKAPARKKKAVSLSLSLSQKKSTTAHTISFPWQPVLISLTTLRGRLDKKGSCKLVSVPMRAAVVMRAAVHVRWPQDT